jgi:hypothetical protein
MLDSATGTQGTPFFVTEVGLQVSPNGNCSPFSNCVLNEAQQAAGMNAVFNAVSDRVSHMLWYDYR